MKLYYSPGACSLAPHIALNETGLHHDAVKVDLKGFTQEFYSEYVRGELKPRSETASRDRSPARAW
jgi:glutathione S-transferase